MDKAYDAFFATPNRSILATNISLDQTSCAGCYVNDPGSVIESISLIQMDHTNIYQ